MVPASLTISAIFADAASVVTEFSSAILLAVGVGLGIWGVRFIIALVRKARR